jgi:hypothetical protein
MCKTEWIPLKGIYSVLSVLDNFMRWKRNGNQAVPRYIPQLQRLTGKCWAFIGCESISQDKRGMLCTDGFMDFLATIAVWERSKDNSHMNRIIHKF